MSEIEPTAGCARLRRYELIIDEVCRTHHISRAELFGRRRLSWVVAARRALVVALFNETGCLSETGRLVGLDHTTVLHHVRAHRARAEKEALAKPTAPMSPPPEAQAVAS